MEGQWVLRVVRPGDVQQPVTTSLEAVWEKYRSYRSGTRRERTLESDEAAHRALQAMEVRAVSDITVEALDQQVSRRRRKHVAARTIRLEAFAVRAFTKWCVERGHVEVDPLAAWTSASLPEDDGRWARDALSVPEARSILDHAPPDDRLMWLIFMASGLRSGELCRSKWADLDGRTIRLGKARTKTHAARYAYIGPVAAAELEARRGSADEIIFPSRCFGRPLTRAGCLKRFYRALERAGIKRAAADVRKLDVHSLRATCATLLGELGVDLKTAESIIGHRGPQNRAGTTLLIQRYMKTSMEKIAAATERLEALLVAREA